MYCQTLLICAYDLTLKCHLGALLCTKIAQKTNCLDAPSWKKLSLLLGKLRAEQMDVKPQLMEVLMTCHDN